MRQNHTNSIYSFKVVMDFGLFSGKMAAEKITGDDQQKQQLYDIKYVSHVFLSAVLMFTAALFACLVLYHAAPSLQDYYSGGFTFSPAKTNVSSSSVSI